MTTIQPTSPRLLVRAPATRSPERRYILDLVLKEWLGVDFDLEPAAGSIVTLSVPGSALDRHVTLPDAVLGVDREFWLTARSMPRCPLQEVRLPPSVAATIGCQTVPLLYGADVADVAWTETVDGIRLNVDVFGASFFMLSRMEELVVQERDRHDRFPAARSVAVDQGFVERPLVDEYVELLAAALNALWPGICRPRREYRVRLTHDIDRPWTMLPGMSPLLAARSLAGDAVRRRDARLALRRLRAIADAKSDRFDRDPLATFDFLMQTSERHGLRSTFYFLAGGTDGEYDFRYRIDHPYFQQVLRTIHERGHEIGLHGSYISHRDPARLKVELEALIATARAAGVQQPSWGVRQHYLRFSVPETWRHQSDAGLAHDSTVGFAERIGFRSGTCREHPVFDVAARQRLPIRERPLVAMDVTLSEYMGLSPASAAARVRRVVEACRRHGGDAVILMHNDSVAGQRSKSDYQNLIAELAGAA